VIECYPDDPARQLLGIVEMVRGDVSAEDCSAGDRSTAAATPVETAFLAGAVLGPAHLVRRRSGLLETRATSPTAYLTELGSVVPDGRPSDRLTGTRPIMSRPWRS
jgi:hypothetical protein